MHTLLSLVLIPLLGTSLFPESITLDSRTGALYIGSNGDGSIQIAEKNQARVFQPPGTDGRTEALGVKVDPARDRLWVLDGANVYVYFVSKNTLIKKIA